MYTNVPGFSSRSTTEHTRQFPQRDEAAMADVNEAGWSNSEPVEHAPEDVRPEVQAPEEMTPGFSNGKAVTTDAAEAKVIASPSTESKTAKKASAKKKS